MDLSVLLCLSSLEYHCPLFPCQVTPSLAGPLRLSSPSQAIPIPLESSTDHPSLFQAPPHSLTSHLSQSLPLHHRPSFYLSLSFALPPMFSHSSPSSQALPDPSPVVLVLRTYPVSGFLRSLPLADSLTLSGHPSSFEGVPLRPSLFLSIPLLPFLQLPGFHEFHWPSH